MNAVAAYPGFLTGADPELFVFDRDGRAVSAAGLLPGDKQRPHKVKKGAIQVDGMAAEFNIDPASSFEEFEENIVTVMMELRSFLPKGYTLKALPSVVFDQEVWDAAPPEAKELGCSPDFNAWTGGVNAPPSCETQPTLRTASGHLHIGWTKDADLGDISHINNAHDLVKQLDWFLGAWSVRVDGDPTRRLLYGKAGACRIKDYGVEYRVLSNFWLTSKARRLEVWNRLHTAIGAMRTCFYPEEAKHYSEFLIESINTSSLNRTLTSHYKNPILTY